MENKKDKKEDNKNKEFNKKEQSDYTVMTSRRNSSVDKAISKLSKNNLTFILGVIIMFLGIIVIAYGIFIPHTIATNIWGTVIFILGAIITTLYFNMWSKRHLTIIFGVIIMLFGIVVNIFLSYVISDLIFIIGAIIVILGGGRKFIFKS